MIFAGLPAVLRGIDGPERPVVRLAGSSHYRSPGWSLGAGRGCVSANSRDLPDPPQACFNLGVLLLQQQGPGEAKSLFARAVSGAPQQPACWQAYLEMLLQLDELGEARRVWSEACRTSTNACRLWRRGSIRTPRPRPTSCTGVACCCASRLSAGGRVVLAAGDASAGEDGRVLAGAVLRWRV